MTEAERSNAWDNKRGGCEPFSGDCFLPRIAPRGSEFSFRAQHGSLAGQPAGGEFRGAREEQRTEVIGRLNGAPLLRGQGAHHATGALVP